MKSRLTSVALVVTALLASVAAIASDHPLLATGAGVCALYAMIDGLPLLPAGYRWSPQTGGVGGPPLRTLILDANETAFFQRQLEHIKARTYDVKYAELRYAEFIPVSTEAGSGATTILYYTYDQVGVAKIIASYADDLPRADVFGKENRSPIRSLGDSYGYNVQEIRSAAMAGVPLTQRKANAARRAMEQAQNTIAWFGDSASGLLGLLNHPNITRASAPNDGTAGARTFASKTPDQIIRDLNNLANTIVSLTKGLEIPDTLLLPIAQYNYIASTPRSSTSDTTILEFFLGANPYIKRVGWLNEAAGAGVTLAGTDVAVAYRRDPDALTLEIPQPFEQFPPQERNLEFVVPCHQRTGGVIVYYPLSISVLEGI